MIRGEQRAKVVRLMEIESELAMWQDHGYGIERAHVADLMAEKRQLTEELQGVVSDARVVG